MKKSKYENKFIEGEKFGSWTISNKEIIKHPDNREATIKVKCDCGFEDIIRCLTIVKGQSKGCFNCGHNNKGENHQSFKGYKEIPGSWFTRYKNRSNIWEFNITIEEVYNIWIKQNKKCALSNLEIDFENVNFRKPTTRKSAEKFSKNYNYDLKCTASLDRIDSLKGYIKGNIQLVHKDVNMMKKEYDQDYYIKICSLVAENKFGK
jgi:hypothetical protein